MAYKEKMGERQSIKERKGENKNKASLRRNKEIETERQSDREKKREKGRNATGIHSW